MTGHTVPPHGGNLYAAMRQRGDSSQELLDFSANINPLGLSKSIRQSLLASLETIIHYPDAQSYALTQELSHYYQVDPKGITIGNGAVELMYILCHMLKPKGILVTAPTFSEYEAAGKASGAKIEYFSLRETENFTIEIDKLAKQLAHIDIVFLCNPNNPTGTLLRRAEIEKLLIAAKVHQTYVVVDESFIDFLTNEDEYTCRPLLERYPNLIILHSLTKFYAIPGLRLGFSLASPEITQKLHLGKDPWNVNTLAQNAGVVALRDFPYQQQSKEYIKKANQELYQNLQQLPGLKPYLPSVNFILINCKDTGLTSTELQKAMASYHILIRDCSNYPGLSSDYIRIAVKNPTQNTILLTTLGKIIGEMK